MAASSSNAGWANALTIFGLTVAWFTTYVIVCMANGSFPSVTERDAPSRLFSFGGVLGMQRPTLEVVWEITLGALIGIAALSVCDLLYARHTQARYFALHVICNAWISLLCLPDLLYIISDPVNAMKQRETVNHWPTSLVFSIHLYHMAFFKNLQWIDWLHHILMVVIGAPLLLTGEMGHLMNFNHFFMCGVPGGADYAMLFAVKHGWMDPLDEKKYNSMINVWIREPALVVTAAYGYVQIHLQHENPDLFKGGITAVRIFLCLLATWNGLFFMERVVGNYHVCAYKAKLKKGSGGGNGAAAAHEQRAMSPQRVQAHAQKAAGGANGSGGGDGLHKRSDSFTYDSEEHFTTGLPMVGMRVSVSAQDLKEINQSNKTPASIIGRHEPYPVPAKKDN